MSPHPGDALRAAFRLVWIFPVLLGLAACPAARADLLPVVLDGYFDDWDGVSPAWVDPTGDGGSSGIDLGRLWLADDDEFFYLRFETGTEILLNEGHSLQIFLDTDNDAGTGLIIAGIGADLIWKPGLQEGQFWVGGGQITVESPEVRFRALPSHSATAFEAAFGKDALPNGSTPLFPSSEIKVMLRDFTSGGDWLPDVGQTLSYTFDQGSLPPESPLGLAKENESDVRIITWNVLQDRPWNSNYDDKFRRQLQAVQPQIIAFQEIYNHTPAQTAALVESWLPSGSGQFWFSGGTFDCHTVSRYPIQGSWALDGNTAFLLNTTAALGKKTLLINVHLPCCDNDTGRQAEVDRILAFIRDAKTTGGTLDLAEGSPILIMGDTNFVGDGQQLISLLTGDIIDEGSFGPDIHPDWDETDLTDLVSRQTHNGMGYTWRNDSGSYWPGRLDYIIYTDSAVEVGNHFILYPPLMSADSLLAYGLEPDDHEGSDHIMVCADIRPRTSSGVEENGSIDSRPADLGLRLAPNPSSLGATIGFRLDSPARLTLELFDPTGRLVARPLAGAETAAGVGQRTWNGTGLDGALLPSGVYFARLSSEAGASQTVRWIRVR